MLRLTASLLTADLQSRSSSGLLYRIPLALLSGFKLLGGKDDVATPAIARGIQQQIAGSKLVEFNTGHFMMAEDPERFRSVLGDFLRTLQR